MKYIFLITLFSSLFLYSCSEEKIETQKKYFQTAIVQSGSVLESENYIGYTDSFHNVQLSAKIGGKITSLSKKVGERVTVWEVVGTLDATEAKTWFQSSNDILASLESLKISTSQMFDSQINVMEQKIDSAKTGIEIADVWLNGTQAGYSDTQKITENQIKTIETQILSAQTGLETTQLQLENTKNTLTQKETDIYSNSKNALSSANILWNNILDFLDNLFGITDANKYKSDSYDTYISAKNTNLKNQIKNDFFQIQLKLQESKKLPLGNNEEIKIALEKYNQLFSQDIRNLLKDSYSAMENSIASTTFSDTSINWYKNQITTLQTQNEQVIMSVSGNYFLWLKGSIDSINAFTKEKKSTLDMMEKQVELAQKQIDTLLQTKNQITSQAWWQITEMNTKTQIAKKQKDLSQNGLNEALAGLEALKKQKLASLSEIDTQINQVKSGKEQSWVMIENGKIISLIAWVITQKHQEIGNVVWGGMPIYSVSSDDKVKIEIKVDENILSRIELWKSVKVEIEGVNEIKDGSISKILPTRDLITKKSTLEITLNTSTGVKIGSYSKVYFDIPNDTNGIIIPNSAIISKYMIPQVYILENGKTKLTPIEIVKQNDTFSQVTWVNVWDIIVTNGKENITDGEMLTQ